VIPVRCQALGITLPKVIPVRVGFLGSLSNSAR
jgi:hypothetical protein